jgi:hypothetical protein
LNINKKIIQKNHSFIGEHARGLGHDDGALLHRPLADLEVPGGTARELDGNKVAEAESFLRKKTLI